MIYLDNAATTFRKPESVIKAAENVLRNGSANPGRSGHRLSETAAERVYAARKTAAEFFGSEGPETVCFTLNCTMSINIVLKGILHSGDHVIISSLEHNAVARPVYALASKGIFYDIAEVTARSDGEITEEFERLIKPNTKMIFCTHASNVCGRILPIEKIGKICKKHGILFGVDAAQTAGVVPVNMAKMNVDFLCAAAHKGLFAPMGLGILISRKAIPETLIEGGTGTDSAKLLQPSVFPEQMESGTVNLPAIAGLTEGIKYVKAVGVGNIRAKELRFTGQLYETLSHIRGVHLYAAPPFEGEYTPVLSFNFEGKNSNEVAEYLNSCGIAVRAGLHCAPLAHKALGTLETGTVRLSPSCFNRCEEIERVCEVLKKYKNRTKIY